MTRGDKQISIELAKEIGDQLGIDRKAFDLE